VLELWSLSKENNYICLSADGPNNLSSLLQPWTVNLMTDLCIVSMNFLLGKTRPEAGIQIAKKCAVRNRS
jgi:hypothetical protein